MSMLELKGRKKNYVTVKKNVEDTVHGIPLTLGMDEIYETIL